MPAAAPDRPNRMDDVIRRQVPSSGAHGLARWAAADGTAFGHDGRSAGSVNGAVDAAAAGKLRVGRIDDRVDVLLGDVTANKRNRGRTNRLLHASASGIARRRAG